MKKIYQIFDDGWEEVCAYVTSSVVFLDEGAAESLHWNGGLNRLLDNGAVSVRNFSIFEKVNPAYKKGIFIVTTLTETTLKTLMILLQGCSFINCILVTPFDAHFCNISKQVDFSNLERQLLQWMGNMNYSAKVLSIPIFGLSLLDELFLLPALSKNFPSLIPELLPQERKEGGLKSLPECMQMSIKMLSSFLHTLLEKLQLNGEIFSLGPLSHIVGQELENLCHQLRKKAHTTKASVLLIDRSLDLAGPLSQSVDTPASKMLRVMPHLPGHVCDVQVDMSALASCNSDTVFGMPLLAPGCIAHKNNAAEYETLVSLFTKKFKEAMMEVNRRVVQVGLKDGITFDSTSAGASKALKKRILAFREHSDLLVKNSGLLQQSLAVVQMHDHPQNVHLDNLLATEKLLLQNFTASQSSISKDIDRLISTRKDRGYKMKDVLTLIALLYALSDDSVLDAESEAAIEATIMETLFGDDMETVELVKDLAGDDANDEDILASVKTLFDVLGDFVDFRKDLKNFGSLFESPDPALPAVYTPLLKQILNGIFKSSDMTDMEFHSTGLRDYIKTGFSLFMNVSKPQPKDNPIIIIFIIGGITANEVKLVNDMVSQYKSSKVFVGSTSLLIPEQTLSDIFSVVKELTAPEESTEDFY